MAEEHCLSLKLILYSSTDVISPITYQSYMTRDLLDEVFNKKVDHESSKIGKHYMLRVNNSYITYNGFYAYRFDKRAITVDYKDVPKALEDRTYDLYILNMSMTGILFRFSTNECIQGTWPELAFGDLRATPIARYTKYEQEVIIEWIKQIYLGLV